MIKEDNKDIVLLHLRMENIRISNELVRKDERIRFLEDILTRIMKGEEVDSSFLPSHYVSRQKREQKVA